MNDGDNTKKSFSNRQVKDCIRFPSIYYDSELEERVKYYTHKLKADVQDLLLFELHANKVPDTKLAISIVNQISRFIIQSLTPDIGYLRDIQIDSNPQIEAFWTVGGFGRPESWRKMLRNLKGVKKSFCQVHEDDPIERHLQFIGSSIMQVRSDFHFGPSVFEDLKQEGVQTGFPYDPRNFELFSTLRYATNNSGYRPACSRRSCLLSIHSTNSLLGKALQQQSKLSDANWVSRLQLLLDSQAVLTSYSKLVAQSYMLGFNQFTDLQRPLSTQTILTNGLDWSFYIYQLNTSMLGGLSIHKNKKINLCWKTKPMKLLTENNHLNLDTFEQVLKFFLIPNFMDTSVKLSTPFITTNLNDIEEDARRELIFENYVDIYSQKKTSEGYEPLPEVYQWEKFFKIDHKLRPQEPRRRFFELPDSMGPKPYKKPYKLRDPRKIPSMLKKLQAAVAVKKEETIVQAGKVAEKQKYAAASTRVTRKESA